MCRRDDRWLDKLGCYALYFNNSRKGSEAEKLLHNTDKNEHWGETVTDVTMEIRHFKQRRGWCKQPRLFLLSRVRDRCSCVYVCVCLHKKEAGPGRALLSLILNTQVLASHDLIQRLSKSLLPPLRHTPPPFRLPSPPLSAHSFVFFSSWSTFLPFFISHCFTLHSWTLCRFKRKKWKKKQERKRNKKREQLLNLSTLSLPNLKTFPVLARLVFYHSKRTHKKTRALALLSTKNVSHQTIKMHTRRMTDFLCVWLTGSVHHLHHGFQLRKAPV